MGWGVGGELVWGVAWDAVWEAVWEAVWASLSGVTACAVTPGCISGVRPPSSGLNRVGVRDRHRVRVRATASAG